MDEWKAIRILFKKNNKICLRAPAVSSIDVGVWDGVLPITIS